MAVAEATAITGLVMCCREHDCLTVGYPEECCQRFSTSASPNKASWWRKWEVYRNSNHWFFCVLLRQSNQFPLLLCQNSHMRNNDAILGCKLGVSWATEWHSLTFFYSRLCIVLWLATASGLLLRQRGNSVRITARSMDRYSSGWDRMFNF